MYGLLLLLLLPETGVTLCVVAAARNYQWLDCS